MKFTRNKIREMVSIYGKPTIVPDDGCYNLTAGMINSTAEARDIINVPDYYYLSKYALFFEQLVTHRAQETVAVRENVVNAIHDTLYGEIIRDLHQVRARCMTTNKEEIVSLLSKLIAKVGE